MNYEFNQNYLEKVNWVLQKCYSNLVLIQILAVNELDGGLCKKL